MKVLKFGGASIKDASGIKNVSSIVSGLKDNSLVIVVSAMAKTTNALEKITEAYFHSKASLPELIRNLKEFHLNILQELFENHNHEVFDEVNNYFAELEWVTDDEMNHGYDHTYDQIVSIGELLSSAIVSAYLNHTGIPVNLIDARDFLKTDNTYRDARVNWEETANNLKRITENNSGAIYLTQGFIGCTSENFNTTLGREGSDYTAAIIANMLDAEELIIWKDVPGVLNADPRVFTDARLIPQLSYHDAVELTYYGATVIHPKTIKPLQNKKIPMRVKSFLNPGAEGTLINETSIKPGSTCYIHKPNQLLVSVSDFHFSFMVEENLRELFELFTHLAIRINLIQHSALSVSFCMDNDPYKREKIIHALNEKYKVLYNDGLELFTIRYYTDEAIAKLLSDKKLILEQRSRTTAQFLVMHGH
jgi:aspartate kinase